jgi:hypothetical protein
MKLHYARSCETNRDFEIRCGFSAVLAAMLMLSASAASLAQKTIAPVLFRDVNVISMATTAADAHRDVLVNKGTIARIGATGSITAPPDAIVVQGGGRYLMPGLAEMHAHLPPPAREQDARDILLLYVAHGITSIRGMLGDPWHLQLRSQIERHEVLGPRLYTAGPSFNGESTPTVERAQTMVREQAAAGYDFLKLHPGLKRNVFDAIVATSRDSKITFQGHVSDDVGVMHALEAKQRAIDHLDGYIRAIADPACARAVRTSIAFGMELAQCVDMKRIPDLARQTKAAGTWMVPTQVLLEQWAVPPTREELQARPAMRYVPADIIDRWLKSMSNIAGPERLSAERGKRYIEATRALLREMHAQGVPILVGSDAPQVFNVPGDSALAELEVYAQIGLPPLEVLRTATTNPARFFNASARFGAVREGLDADLILVDANPLEDIRSLRKLSGVMVRGEWLSRKDLDAKLNELATRVNPKQAAVNPRQAAAAAR